MFGIPSAPRLRQLIIVITVNLEVFAFGLSLGWSSPVLVKLKSQETFLTEPLTETNASWIVAAGFLSSIFVAFLPALLMDRIGRKLCIILCYVPHVIGCVLFLVATKVWVLILGRVFVGISLSLCLSVPPMYSAEIASKDNRGALGTLFQVFCCAGILVMLGIGPFISYSALNIMYTAIVTVTALTSLFLPESPYYLHSKGRNEEAMEILTRLRGSVAAAKEEIEQYKLAEIDQKIDKSMFKDQVFLKTTAIVVIFGSLGHVSGASALTYYLQSILESTKTNINSDVGSAVIGSMKLLACFFTASITDRFGRKPILLWTWFGKAVGMVGLGTYFYARTDHMSAFVNYIPILCIILVIFCHNAGQNSLYYVVSAEMFEGPYRATGVSCATFLATIFNFLLAMYLSQMINFLGPSAAYWTFGGISAATVVFVKAFLPETKGKTFAEIQQDMGRKR